MVDRRRALTLTIDANSAQDMKMLLKQALYEIDQLLPLPNDSSPEERARSAYMKILSPSMGGARVARGHTQGSIGSYEFSYIHSSREYKALEDQLLEQGYQLENEGGMFTNTEFYGHSTLPPKIITGNPLAIEDKPPRDPNGC